MWVYIKNARKYDFNLIKIVTSNYLLLLACIFIYLSAKEVHFEPTQACQRLIQFWDSLRRTLLFSVSVNLRPPFARLLHSSEVTYITPCLITSNHVSNEYMVICHVF